MIQCVDSVENYRMKHNYYSQVLQTVFVLYEQFGITYTDHMVCRRMNNWHNAVHDSNCCGDLKSPPSMRELVCEVKPARACNIRRKGSQIHYLTYLTYREHQQFAHKANIR